MNVCTRIAVLITTAWQAPFLCPWLTSPHCKSCESLSPPIFVWYFLYYGIFILQFGLQRSVKQPSLWCGSRQWLFLFIHSHQVSSFRVNFLYTESDMNLLNVFFLIICSFANNLDLCGPVTGHPCPGSPPFSPPPPFVPPPPIWTPGEISIVFY